MTSELKDDLSPAPAGQPAPDTVAMLSPSYRRTSNPFARAGVFVASRYSLVLLWIAMIALFAVLLPRSIDLSFAARAVLGTQSPMIFLALGLVIMLAVGEFDLSFASIYGLAGAVTVSFNVVYGWPIALSILAAIVVALIFGVVNAILVVRIGVNSVIVTLGTGSLAYGFALLICGQQNVSGIDPALSKIATAPFLGLPAIFWYGVILVAIAAYVMSVTPLGRHMLFVGSNRDVARLAGVPVQRIRFSAYLVSALLSCAAGIILALGVGGFNPTDSATQMLPAFAAAFLGTVAVIPGRFNPIGMLIAAYFLLSGVFGLQLFGGTGWVTNMFYGAALVIAVTISLVFQRRKRG